MDITQSDSRNEGGPNKLGRRKFLKAGLMLGAASLLPRLPVIAQSTERVQPTGDDADKRRLIKADRRRLGLLEVSSIGLGCLPLVGYYDVKLDKNAAIALIRTAFELAPIPGTTKISHLKENVGAAAVQFTSDELRVFNADLSRLDARGARIEPFGESQIDH